jgi:hypothetical protein
MTPLGANKLLPPSCNSPVSTGPPRRGEKEIPVSSADAGPLSSPYLRAYGLQGMKPLRTSSHT